MFSKIHRAKGILAVFVAVWLGMAIARPAHADTAFEGEKTTDKLKFSGDMRLRVEDFFVKSSAASGGVNSGHDRERERFRFRFGVTANLQDFLVGFRLASGVGEQVSTNQTLANDSNQKSLWIDQAYITWKAHEYARITGGKMQNPIWRTYASDLVWDDDVSPEGFAQQVDVPLSDRVGLFANFLQTRLNEAGTLPDPWMLGNQVGSNLKITEDTRLSLAGSYYGFLNEKAGDFVTGSTAVRQYGNSRVGATGQSASIHFRNSTSSLPLSLLGGFL